jgi:hypothetical protein
MGPRVCLKNIERIEVPGNFLGVKLRPERKAGNLTAI